ncbi:MAG: putative rane protein [Bacteroidetes bacterium]|jgi:hypothetical protein|nr:putative rane protein [Bacteroidota bacterium]
METAVSIALGIGLAAAAGFRVFVPLLALSIAGLTGTLELSQGFAWIGTVPALIAFGTATVMEVAAYYIPWVDNILDTIATPAAVVAGTIASASVITDISPLLKWVLALIGGGGIAGLIQGATVLTRAKSSVVTAGMGNPVVATAELGGSIFTTILSFLAPFITIILVLLVCGVVFASARRLLFGHIGAPRE